MLLTVIVPVKAAADAAIIALDDMVADAILVGLFVIPDQSITDAVLA